MGTHLFVRILIVEDNPVNLDLVMQLLEDDYDLLTAEDGQSGVEIALAEKPDLILLLMIRAPKHRFNRVAPQLRLVVNNFRIK